LHTAHWEALAFLLGPLVVGADLFAWSTVRFVTLGALVNAFIFSLNDLADLPRDRQDPSRQGSPLVAGLIDPALALFLSCVLPVVMWLIINPAGWTVAAESAFAALIGLGAYLDVYQKTSPRVHPILLDSLFAVCMAGPIPVTVAALHLPLDGSVWTLTFAFAFLCLGLNSIGGNLKDLESDLRTGFRTVAISLGVTFSSGRPAYSVAYRRFVWSLWLLTSVALTSTAVVAAAGHPVSLRIAVVALVLGCCLQMARSLHHLLVGRRQPSARGRERSFAFGMLAVLVAVGAAARVTSFLLIVGLLFGTESLLRLRTRAHAGTQADA
jgi:4-hydroxybenzoate polyprenyltransferase